MTDSFSGIVADLLAVLCASPQNTGWSSYATGERLISDVAALVQPLAEGDSEAVGKIRLLFAPTGALQETALSTGWHDNYMALAKRVDALVG